MATFYDIVRVLLPAVCGGLASHYAMRWLYSGTTGESIRDDQGEERFTYSARTKKFMIGTGTLCISLAIFTVAAITLKYYGTSPIASTHKLYQPVEDGLAGLGIFVFFCLGGIYCFIDAHKYFCRVSREGISVRGFVSGLRCTTWENVLGITDYPSLQAIAVHYTQKGKPKRLWLSYLLSGLERLLVHVNAHGIFFKEELAAVEPVRQALIENGYSSARPYRFFLPFVTIWKIETSSEQYILALRGWVTEYDTGVELVPPMPSVHDLLVQTKDRLADGGFNFVSGFQRDMAQGMKELIRFVENEPVLS